MAKFCEKCGKPLGSDGLCGNCDKKDTVISQEKADSKKDEQKTAPKKARKKKKAKRI